MNTLLDRNNTELSFAEYFLFKDNAEKVTRLHNVGAMSSGSLVGQGLVLTVAHAVENDESPKIIYKNKILKAKVLFKHTDVDAMLLSFDPSSFEGDLPYLEFGNTVNLGENVYGLGFPLPEKLNFQPVFYSAQVASTDIYRAPQYFQFSGEISNGCSGTALVNDFGKVQGIVSKKAEPYNDMELPNNWNLAVSTPYFINEIKRYLPPTSRDQQSRMSSQRIARILEDTAVVVLACEKRRM
jgi:S1-C subfamily serine protease